jgi:hypothetical protein
MPVWFLFLVLGQTRKVDQPLLGHGKERTRKQTHYLGPRPETSSQTTTDGGWGHGVPWQHTYLDAQKAAENQI